VEPAGGARPVGEAPAGPGSGAAQLGWRRRGRRGEANAEHGRGGSEKSAWWQQRHVWKRYEREKREKERAGPGTIPTYVHRADTSVDEHKQAGLCGGRDTLCLLATRQTYVTYVDLKTDKRNSKYERRPRRT
jgi:hypothetical protein